MKKVFLSLAVVAVLSLVSCKKTEEAPVEAAPVEEVAAPVEEVAADTAKVETTTTTTTATTPAPAAAAPAAH